MVPLLTHHGTLGATAATGTLLRFQRSNQASRPLDQHQQIRAPPGQLPKQPLVSGSTNVCSTIAKNTVQYFFLVLWIFEMVMGFETCIEK